LSHALCLNDTAATDIYTLSLHDALPIFAITGQVPSGLLGSDAFQETDITGVSLPITKHNIMVTKPEEISRAIKEAFYIASSGRPDRKSTRLNSSHVKISYAVFCLKKKKQ